MSLKDLERHSTFYSLRLQWAACAVFCVSSLAGSYVFLHFWWDPDYATRWLVLPSAGMAYLLTVLWRNLDSNHRAGEEQLLSTLGWGNVLTLLRGLLVASLTGFLFLPRPDGLLVWMPAILYAFSIVIDFLDGYVARVSNHATRLGEILDMSFDGLGIMAAGVLAIQYGQVPAWYLAVAFARPIFLAGLWVRKRLNRPLFEIPPSFSRRVFAGFQFGFLAVMLWPTFSPPGTYVAATLFALPLILGFARDWLTVCGMIRPGGPSANQMQKAITAWLPVALRLAVLALSLSQLRYWTRGLEDQDMLFLLLSILLSGAVISITFGAASRIFSVVGLFSLGLFQLYSSLNSTQILLGIALIGILYLGSGQFSLWRPEDQILYRQVGERKILEVEGG